MGVSSQASFTDFQAGIMSGPVPFSAAAIFLKNILAFSFVRICQAICCLDVSRDVLGFPTVRQMQKSVGDEQEETFSIIVLILD